MHGVSVKLLIIKYLNLYLKTNKLATNINLKILSTSLAKKDAESCSELGATLIFKIPPLK